MNKSLKELRRGSAAIDAELDQVVCAAKELILLSHASGDSETFIRTVDRVHLLYENAHSACLSDPSQKSIDDMLLAMCARLGLKRIGDSMHLDIEDNEAQK